MVRSARTPAGRPRPALPALAAWVALAAVHLCAAPGSAQTITGSLIDAESGHPIPLGLVMMYSEAGDSITQTITDAAGRFRIAADDPGSFLLRAAALGYGESTEGVFELGAGGSMEIEYRLRAEPLPLEALLVSVNRPIIEHSLVQNGFVRRLQRGLGTFITPHDIENSPAQSTEALLQGVPAVRVGVVTRNAGELGIPAPHIGETVMIQAPLGGWCVPRVYVDGRPTHYDPNVGVTLSSFVSIADIDAIEVYRRPSEVPVEFEATLSRSGPVGGCGALVLWTKQGLAPGQRPQRGEPADPDDPVLPSVSVTEVPAQQGERMRLDLGELAEELGVERPWVARLLTVEDDVLVAADDVTGRPVSVPLRGIRGMHVERPQSRGRTVRKAAIYGAIGGVGTWGFLTILCEWTCGRLAESEAELPGLIAGGVVFGFTLLRGPGNEWVEAPVPTVTPGPTPGAFGLGLRVPAR